MQSTGPDDVVQRLHRNGHEQCIATRRTHVTVTGESGRKSARSTADGR